MINLPTIDPVAFSVGSFPIYWYGLMYLLAFSLAWGLGYYRAKQPGSGWTIDQLGDLIFYSALGAIVGGRLGYILFYNIDQILIDPASVFRVWEGGMSFHGGLLGVIFAIYLFSRRTKKTLFNVADFATPLVPLGLAMGRIGNFINGELWGRVTDVSWGVIFPQAGTLPRHPSQLYEFALEGLILFAIVWCFSSRPRPAGAVAGVFLIGYAVFRFVVEFFREPDLHMGFVAFDWMTMGQLLSAPMLVLGLWLVWQAYRKKS